MTGFSVLFVCTGNLYRSVIAECLLTVHLGREAGGFAITSAGTAARPGMPLDPRCAEVIRELGGETRDFAPRRLTGELVAAADLVLGLAQEHRESAVRLKPVALRRCFTLEEFAVLTAEACTASGPRALVAHAADTRGRRTPPAPDAESVEDPDGRPLDELRACAARIDRVVRRVAESLSARQDVLVSS